LNENISVNFKEQAVPKIIILPQRTNMSIHDQIDPATKQNQTVNFRTINGLKDKLKNGM